MVDARQLTVVLPPELTLSATGSLGRLGFVHSRNVIDRSVGAVDANWMHDFLAAAGLAEPAGAASATGFYRSKPMCATAPNFLWSPKLQFHHLIATPSWACLCPTCLKQNPVAEYCEEQTACSPNTASHPPCA
jgi:hypothetical protein